MAVLFTRGMEHRRLVAAYSHALDMQPGIQVTAAEWSDRRVRISGFRDSLS